MKKNNVLLLVFTFVSFFVSNTIYSQYYQAMGLAPGNPGGLNKDSDYYFGKNGIPTGATVVYSYADASSYVLQYLTTQTIPFAFNFNGNAVSQYTISTSGYLTFSSVSGSPAGPNPASLPCVQIPDNSICIWGFSASGGGGAVYTKVFGTSPNQQLWITFSLGGNANDPNSVDIWSIVLEQTSNNIYLVDRWGNIGYIADAYNPFPLALGVQINATKAYSVNSSPNLYARTWTPAYNDNIYYEFTPDSANAYTPLIKYPLVEEFMQASCDPCYQAARNVDTVLTNNSLLCNPIHIHVSWPGTDYINNVTQSPFVNTRVVYYGVNSVPDAKLDGLHDLYPGAGNYNSLSSTLIQDEEAVGSPFQMTVKDSFDMATDTYYAIGSVKAVQAFAAGLKLTGYITVDNIKYTFDQSTEDPNNNSTYLLNFPEAAEEMITPTGGTSLKAFVVGQSQTFTYSWKKNHAWGAYTAKKCYCYDSTDVHITMFVQSSTTHYVYQSVTAAQGETVTNGVAAISNASGFSFNLYPNPSNGTFTNLAFNLTQSSKVNIQIINLIGQVVYSSDNGAIQGGQHIIEVNTSNLQNGIYFVKLNTENNSSVKKLLIVK